VAKNKVVSFIFLIALYCEASYTDSISERCVQNHDSLEEAFENSCFFGRFRANSFFWNWKENSSKNRDNSAAGVGGSLLFKSGYFKGIGATIGLYYTYNPLRPDVEDIGYLKSGKDTFSRKDALVYNRYSITVPAQSFLEYKNGGLSLKVGRFLCDTMLLKANDTKMIPNSFEGFWGSYERSAFSLEMGYILRQKLRDKSDFHDPITYGKDLNNNGILDDGAEIWSGNDDSAAHRGLNEIALQEAGKSVKNRLKVIRFSVNENLGAFAAEFMVVPGLLEYRGVDMAIKKSLRYVDASLGFRYLIQKDIGAGVVAGPNLRQDDRGYVDHRSLDAELFGVKVDLKKDFFKIRLGYTAVADKADFVTPWRGFPTGGYTRAMGQYNWYANTKSYMLRADLDLNGVLIDNGYTFFRYVIQDFDDKKPGVQADSEVFELDFVKRFDSLPGLSTKIRTALVEERGGPGDYLKPNPSYSELRVEVNYRF